MNTWKKRNRRRISSNSGSVAGQLLEPRLLLASISGKVFNDYDADGAVDPGEPGLGGWAVYQDLNNNGTRDNNAPQTVSATDVPKTMPDPGTGSSTLNVAGVAGTISDVDVTVNLSHTYVGDVTMTLVSPAGVRITLVDQLLDGDDNSDNFANTIFDDEAATSITAANAPRTGRFRPAAPLSGLDNLSPNGAWKLEIADAFSEDVGVLNSWSLTFTTAEAVATTDPAGQYSFTGLPAGTYPIRVVAQSPLAPTAPASGLRTVTVGAADNVVNQDFGHRATPGEVRGTAWSDTDGDGVRDAGEPGLAGVRVYVDVLENATFDNGTDPSAVTAADGTYTIVGVPPGVWGVREVVPAGYELTYPRTAGLSASSAGAQVNATVAPAAVDTGATPTNTTTKTKATKAARAAAASSSSSTAPVVPPFLPVWAPGTPSWTVDAFYEKQQAAAGTTDGGPAAFTFADTDRWTSTATNGSGLTQGRGTTLTWTIVPDGTPINSYNAGEAAGPSNLRAFLNGIYGSEAAWMALFQQIFDSWSQLSGVSYVYANYDDGSELTTGPGVLGVRADMRIGGHRIDGNSNVLAYNFFPNFGDMVIDTADNFYANNLANNSLGLRNVLSHEHGHGLGLDHVMPTNQTKLMEPFISFAFDGPQHDDILAANRGYGDRFEKGAGNDVLANATPLGAVNSGTATRVNVSIDDDSDVDLYKFSVNGLRRASVTVTPIGSTYLSGEQFGAAPVPFNSLAQSDLAVQILRADGAVAATANSAGIGLAETLNNVSLDAAGDYYVRVSGGQNAAQMYEVTLNVSVSFKDAHVVEVASGQAATNVNFGNRPTAPPAEVSVLLGATPIPDGQVTAIGFGPVTQGGTAPQRTFVVRNDGGLALNTSGLTVPPGFVIVEGLSASIPAGGADEFTIALGTAAAGSFAGDVSFTTDDADEGTFNFRVSGTVAPADATPPRVAAGTFDVNVGPQHRVVLTFSEDVFASLQAGDFALRNLTTGADFAVANLTWDVGTTSATLLFNQTLPNGNYRVTALAVGIADGAGNKLDGNGDATGGDDHAFDFYVHAGDVDRNRIINFDDLLILAANYNKSGKTFTQGDVDYNGTVNFDDLLILASRYNTSIAAPPPPATIPAAAAASSATTSVLADDAAAKPVFSTTRVAKPAPAQAKAKPAAAKPKAR